MNIVELEAWMRNHIEVYVATEGQLMSGTFGARDQRCACAVGACLPSKVYDPVTAFADLAGVPYTSVWQIADGFDGNSLSDSPYYELGARLRRDYLKL